MRETYDYTWNLLRLVFNAGGCWLVSFAAVFFWGGWGMSSNALFKEALRDTPKNGYEGD